MNKRYRYCPVCGSLLKYGKLENKDKEKRTFCPKCRWIDYKNPLPVAIAAVKQDNLLMEDVEQVSVDNENIQVRALFGESKNLEGYCISEVNLMDNYVILQQKAKGDTVYA